MHFLDLSIVTRIVIGISAMVLLFASFLVAFISSQRRKLQYQKSLNVLNQEQQLLLTRQNEELEKKVAQRTNALSQQKEELQKSLTELKATQLQLIQREKMASLGELTAGIAHEIQNPLNFVNNFSDVSKEMAEEMEREFLQGNPQEALSLAKGLKENLDKISQHGKRAEGIVKGMLQHATASSGTKEKVNINDLADEYLRLTYQTFRARHKDFHVHLQTSFAQDLTEVSVYTLDLMRVLVNLYTNALYALYQKQKMTTGLYSPSLAVSTALKAGYLEIRVQDNGIGMSAKTASKIYQPFFTTKPAGEGTGLGLSLSYDIVTKGHGGELVVETREGEGATFIVRLPVT